MYVKELRRRLPAHCFHPVPYRALWIIPYVTVVIAATIAIIAGPLSLPLKLGVSAVIGIAFSCLELLGHEIIHGSVVRQPWARDLLGGICLMPSAVSPTLWRLWHNVAHHGNTQVHGRDPDAYSTLAQYYERPALRLLHRFIPVQSVFFFVLLSIWFTGHAIIVLIHTLPRLPWGTRLRLLAETMAPLSVWIGMGIEFGWGNFSLFFIIPLLVDNLIVMSIIATNHLLNPLLEDDDPLEGSLSVVVPKVLDVLHSNFSHHTEHHVFPAMSAKYLPQVKILLKELWPARYHELPLHRALSALWRTPRLYVDAVHLIDPQSGKTYGVLGHGLDPNRVTPLD